MNKEKIKWCCEQKQGIEIIDLKSHLSESYMKEADIALENMLKIDGKWKVIIAYYSCYSAIYSLLMRCGIKCEIHDCSLELLELFGFTDEEINYIKQLKNNRIQDQYYLKDIPLENESEVKDFILKCKKILNELNDDKINKIRNEIKEMK